MYSAQADGTDIINLTAKGIKPQDFVIGLKVSKDGQTMFYVNRGNIYESSLDGSKTKQLTKNTSFDPPYNVNLQGVNSDGSWIVFSYEGIPGMQIAPENPNIKYGWYLLNTKSDQVARYIDPKNEIGNSFSFLGFWGENPIFSKYGESIVYLLDPLSLQFNKHSKVKFPNISQSAIVDTNKRTVTFFERPSNSSQLVRINYETGETIQISPKGNFAEYQGLSPSPDLNNYIFEHQIQLPGGYTTGEFFLYNVASRKLTKLSANLNGGIKWVNSDTFVYEFIPVDKGIKTGATLIYKYNVSDGKQEKLFEEITLLDSNPNLP